MFLLRVVEALEKRRVRYAVAGGYAVALSGVPRGTLDVDLVLEWTRKNLEAAEAALSGLGLRSRLPIAAADVFAFRKEYVEKRNLIGWAFQNPHDPSELVDLLVPHDLKGMRTKVVKVEGRAVRILERSELVRMKKASGRPQDMEDAKALEELS